MRARRRHARMVAVVATVGIIAGVPVVSRLGAEPTDAGSTALVSVGDDETAGNDDSSGPSLSADGNRVAFMSDAGNLTAEGDGPRTDSGDSPDRDVFVRDVSGGTTVRASLTSDGAEVNENSDDPVISGDGGQVAFAGDGGLVTEDEDGDSDIYGHDLATRQTTLITRQGEVLFAGNPSLSNDGRLVAYEADYLPQLPSIVVQPDEIFAGSTPNTVRVVAVGSVPSHVTVTVNPPSAATVNSSACPTLVLNPGQVCDLLVTVSDVGTLTLDDGGPGSPQVVALRRIIVKIASIGTTALGGPPSVLHGPVVSNLGIDSETGFADVGFINSGNVNLVLTGLKLTPEGTFFTDSGCINRTLVPGETCQVRVVLSGTRPGPQSAELTATYHQECDPSVPPEECFGDVTSDPVIVFGQVEAATVLVTDRDTDGNGVFDELTGTAFAVVSTTEFPFAPARGPSLSGDGTHLAFTSEDPLVAGDANETDDVFRVPVTLTDSGVSIGAPELVSVSTSGGSGENGSRSPSISGDGHAVAFESGADDLVPPSVPIESDGIYVRDLTAGQTTLVTLPEGGFDTYGAPALSQDARTVAYVGTDFGGCECSNSEIEVTDVVRLTRTRASVGPLGEQTPDTDSDSPAIDADGSVVGFDSRFAEFVDGDDNDSSDVFLRSRPAVGVMSPNPLDFGDQPVGHQSAPLPLEIKNIGLGPMVVGELQLSGPDAGDFTVDNQCLGLVLYSEESCLASTVRVTPSRTGALTATLTLVLDGESLLLDLRATGVVGVLTANPSPLNLGQVPLGTTGPQVALTLTNSGQLPVRLTAMQVSGPDAGSVLAPAGPPCGGAALTPGQSCQFGLRLRPGHPALHHAVLRVEAVSIVGEDPAATADAIVLDVPIVGTGVPGGLLATPNPLLFPVQPVGIPGAPRTVTVRAVGGQAQVVAAALSGANAADFRLLPGGTCTGAVLAPGGTCRIPVAFAPTLNGPRTAALIVTTVDSGTITVALRGSGAVPSLVLNPPIGPPGTVVHVTGAGWLPGSVAAMAWQPGIGGTRMAVNAAGRISGYALVLPRESPGARKAMATNGPLRADADFLVVPPGTAPPRLTNTD